MKRPILTEPDPRLHQPADPVEEFGAELKQLVADMRETMHAARGIGLAGPQVGEMKQVLVLEYEPESAQEAALPFLALANPRITWTSPETITLTEGCLSLPGLEGKVTRPRRVRVKGQLPDGSRTIIKASGLLARVLQHEIDHLNGILYPDRMDPGTQPLPIQT